MTYDPDPRKKISRDFFNSCLYAYHKQAPLLSDYDSQLLKFCIDAYTSRSRVTRWTFTRAKHVLKNLHDQS